LISNIRYYNKMKTQEKKSGKLVKKHKQFHRNLIDRVQESGQTPYQDQPGAVQSRARALEMRKPPYRLNATGFGSIEEKNEDIIDLNSNQTGMDDQNQIQRGITIGSYMDIKNRTLLSLDNGTEVTNMLRTAEENLALGSTAYGNTTSEDLVDRKVVTGFSDSAYNMTLENFKKDLERLEAGDVKKKRGAE
jgi:hypothetical protein